MVRTAARSFLHNGEALLFLLQVTLLLVASQPVFSFGLAPTHKAFPSHLSSVSSRQYFLWRYQGQLPRQGSGNGVLSPIFATPEDSGSKSNKKTTKTGKSPGKKDKPTKSAQQKSTKKGISHLANDTNLSSLTKNNPTWDQNIAALLEYNETHGTVNLPEKSKEYPNLAQWVKNLRNMKGRLTKEQVQQLDDIGFLLKGSFEKKSDVKWHEMFLRLVAFKEEYGHCRVPNKYKPDKQLGLWVMTQRKLYRDEKIREDRKVLLDSVGFVWRLKPFCERDRPDLEELWEKRYQELIEFKGAHNHTNVPHDYPPNKELGDWVYTQRLWKKDGKLSEGRQAQLDKIGFIWDFEPIWDESWLAQFEEVKTFYQELAVYKEMMENSPEGSKDMTRPVLSIRLCNWSVKQRIFNAGGDLDPERKAMLDDIGFNWRE